VRGPYGGSAPVMAESVRRPPSCVRQMLPSDCGPAALSTVASYHGLECSPASIRAMAGTSSEGTSLAGMAKASRRLGFHVTVVEANVSAVRTFPLPAIALLKGELQDHYVVLFSLTDDNLFTIGDPECGATRQLPLWEFEARWKNVCLLLIPTWRMRLPSLVRRLPLIAGRGQHLVASTVIAAIATLLALVPTVYLQRVVDSSVGGAVLPLPVLLTIAALAMLLVRSIALWMVDLLLAGLGRQLQQVLQQTLLEKLLRNVRAGPNPPVGEWIAWFNEAQSARYAFVDFSSQLVLEVVLVVAAVVAMLVYNPRLGAVALLTVPLYGLAWCLELPVIRRARTETFDLARRFGGALSDAFNGLAVIQAFGADGVFAERLGALIEQLQASLYRLRIASSIRRAGLALLSAASIVLLTLLAARQVGSGGLTVGGLAAYFGLVGLLHAPLERMSEALSTYQEGRVAADELSIAIRSVWEEPSGHLSTPLRGAVQFERVSFRYPETDWNALANVSFRVDGGSMVGIAGESGSGKTTLLRVLLQFARPTDGHVLFDDIDSCHWSLAHLRASIALVPQTPELFDATVRENILVGRRAFNDEIVWRAVARAGLYSTVQRLPQQLDTPLRPGQMALSGGESQRLALARALLADPAILLLDEPTSALDGLNEAHVRETLSVLRGSCTVIIASHRPAVLWDCDKIMVMAGGTLVEQGARSVLLGRKSRLRGLLEQQMPFLPALEQASGDTQAAEPPETDKLRGQATAKVARTAAAVRYDQLPSEGRGRDDF